MFSSIQVCLNKNFKLSENNFLSAIRINKKLKNELNLAECNYEMAQLFKEIGNRESEVKYLNDALEYYKKIGSKEQIEDIQNQLN